MYMHTCSINHLIPEVNSSPKLDHKSFIDRSQVVECTTEFFKASHAAFLYKGTILQFLFVECCFDIYTLNKHSIMITNTRTSDDLSLDDKSVFVSYIV